MTETLSTTAARRASLPATVWNAFRRFRKTRPFWGALVLALGGYFVLKPVLNTNFQLLVHLGMGGAQVYILGLGMLACAAVCMFAPSQRYFPAFMGMVFSVASLPLANLGGWIIGMFLGIIGSGLCFSWAPYTDKQLAKIEVRTNARAARRAAKAGQRKVAA